MKSQHLHKLLGLCLVVVLVATSGCSLFGGGKKKGLDGTDSSLGESDLNGSNRSGNIPSAEGEGMFRDIHFDYDSSQLGEEGRQDLQYNSQVLRDNSGLRIQLEGHCDERGTEEYNMALGQRRASAIKSALTAMGISSSRLETVSYGENVPLVPGNSESAWAKNRRVHFSSQGGQ